MEALQGKVSSGRQVPGDRRGSAITLAAALLAVKPGAWFQPAANPAQDGLTEERS